MPSLRSILAERPGVTHFALSSVRVGPCRAQVALTVYPSAFGGLLASATCAHQDPEGAFCEALDVSHVLDRVGEEELDAALDGVVFQTGLTAAVSSKEDFAHFAPEILTH
jgi:hypothetical protein